MPAGLKALASVETATAGTTGWQPLTSAAVAKTALRTSSASQASVDEMKKDEVIQQLRADLQRLTDERKREVPAQPAAGEQKRQRAQREADLAQESSLRELQQQLQTEKSARAEVEGKLRQLLGEDDAEKKARREEKRQFEAKLYEVKGQVEHEQSMAGLAKREFKREQAEAKRLQQTELDEE